MRYKDVGDILEKMKKDSRFVLGKDKITYGYAIFGKKERDAINKVLDKNWWGPAGETTKFEEELAKFLGCKHAVFVNSGSSALDVGIRSLKLPKGSEVIVPACTFPTPISSLVREGLTPVVADIDLGSYFLSPESFEKQITKKTSAVLLVYVAGACGSLKEILRIARKHKLKVIEDNCDGFGGKWGKKMLGSFGDVSAVSTHAAHNISTGAGGVAFTNNPKLAYAFKSMRDWGRVDFTGSKVRKYKYFPPDYIRFIYVEHGSYYGPLELQSAMGRIQLRRLEEFKKKRTRNYNVLQRLLLPYKDKLILPESHPLVDACWLAYPITLNKIQRTKVLKVFDEAKIEWRPILTGNISRQPAFKDYVVARSRLPNADRLLKDSFWVSVHPVYSTKVMEYIAKCITKAIS